MIDFIAQLDEWAKWLISIGAAIAVVAGFMRWILPLWRSVKSDTRAIRDTLVGREPVLDSITGEEIRPAMPGIGTRVDSIEKQGQTTSDQLGILTRAVSDMARNQDRIDSLEHRVAAIESGAFLERIVGRAESLQLYRTMETAIKSDPDETDDADRP